MAISIALPWSDGERHMQTLLRVPRAGLDNPTSSFLTPQAVNLLVRAPLLALGALDNQGRPWATVWGGASGFAQPLGGSIFGVRLGPLDRRYDPVMQALVDGKADGEVVKEEMGKGRMVAGLPIDLETRKRVKIYGRMVAASLSKYDGDDSEDEGQDDAREAGAAKRREAASDDDADALGQMQLVVKTEQSLGNCPKYLNAKTITPTRPRPRLVSTSPALTPAARAIIAKSDLFFIASANTTVHDMDVNHRGGPPGFVRIVPPSTDNPSAPTTIVYPEYSGNRLYQTLGNLHANPLAGLCFPDFATGAVLYVTGRTTIHAGADAARLLPRSNLAVAIEVADARLVEGGLAFRGAPARGKGVDGFGGPDGLSPYNPPVRVLAAEGSLLAGTGGGGGGAGAGGKELRARLERKELLTPDVARFTFVLSESAMVGPGQWVALDASEELDQGYSHMRDDDPESLNDDFVRTFTVTGADGWCGGGGDGEEVVGPSREFSITIKRHGPVTGMLFAANERAGLGVAVRGFGGEFRIKAEDGAEVPFIAGGVGITPLLAELAYRLDPKSVRLFWTLRAGDAALVDEVFARYPDLPGCAKVFFTGTRTDGVDVEAVRATGAVVELRRLAKEDFEGVDSKKWYLCAGTPLRKGILKWLEGRGEVLFEDFNF